MAKNHGIYRKLPNNHPSGSKIGLLENGIFRNGIRQIFRALTTTEAGLDFFSRTRVSQLEFHYGTVSQRFIFSVQHVNLLMQELAAEFNQGKTSISAMSLSLEAECHADHMLSYLGSMVDDIALVIVHATGIKTSVDSMGKLKERADDAALRPVSHLLKELDEPGSWWELAFKRKIGGRQLLVHNQSFIQFQGSSLDGKNFESRAFLIRPLGQGPALNFFELLHNILASLFSWLDRLESALTSHLCENTTWTPESYCPAHVLPVGYPKGEINLHSKYFLIPLCDGSDPLPWTFTVG